MRIISLAFGAIAAVAVTGAAADAVVYGKLHVSLDYIDASANAAWNRPAIGAPSFDMEQFIDAGNARLGEAGYVGVPGPGGVNTAVADVLFGTVDGLFPPFARDPNVQEGLFRALRDATTPGIAYKGWDLSANDRASRIGIKGSEDLGGPKAVYQIEIHVPLADNIGDIDDGEREGANTQGGISMRNSFVGLSGGWGTLLVGRHDTALKMSTGRLDLFADTLADYNVTVGFHDVRADNAILYLSPAFYGVQLAGTLVAAGGATVLGEPNPDADGLAEAWSLAATFRHGPLYAAAAYEVLGKELWRQQEGAYDTAHGLLPADDKKWRIGLGLLDWRGLTVVGLYESRKDILGMPQSASASLWQLQTAYAFGNNRIKAMYGQSDLEECSDPWDAGFRYTCTIGLLGQILGSQISIPIDQKDKTTWAIGLDHYFSKRTMAYALYTALDDGNRDADWSGFSLGMAHRF
jgi:predicted porin